MTANPFLVSVSDLVHRPGARRHERVQGRIEDLEVTGSRVPPTSPVRLDLVLESVQDGILATGTATVVWSGDCARCLRPVTGELAATYQELFEDHPTEGASYPLRHEQVDLEPLAREAVLLELPQVPLCDEGCPGLCPRCGADLNEGPCGCVPDDRDPRWAALDALRLNPED